MDFQKIIDLLSYNPAEPLLFNSAFFLCLFLGFYLIYILLKDLRHIRILYVVLFSLFFYYKCSGIYFLLLIFSSIVDFYLALWIYKSSNAKVRKTYLIISCIINLGLLAYFKYTFFLIDNINTIIESNFSFDTIFLPIGISFFTFQTMSYTIDIYRNELKPTKSVLDFMFFVSFFPQLVAGPIVRAKDFIPQIYQKLSLSKKQLNHALFLIITGLIKKAIISDYISSNFVDRIFEFPQNYSGFENLLAVYGYTLQIYCDFSGYSDIAIGLALLMGFTLPINFNTPYQSTSITEFWRRWHISLSSWLRDYLYISLGGNRKGKIRTYFNLFMTMLLGGLWHGASWKFVFWGAMHGTVLVIEKAFSIPKFSSKNLFLKILGAIFTFHFVAFCWIFFRARDFSSSMLIIDLIGDTTFSLTDWWTILVGYKNVMLLIFIGYLLHFIPKKIQDKQQYFFSKIPLIGKAILLATVIWLIYATASSDIQPFIYFQF